MLNVVRHALWGAIALTAGPAFAHGGGLNAEGCHNDRKRGGYHCHRGGGSASANRPFSSSLRDRAPSRSSLQPTIDGAYRNCTHARAAGAAPVRRGEPGYGSHLDRDGDGVGCE